MFLSDYRLSTYECVLDMRTGLMVSDATKEYHLLHAAKADLYRRLERREEAAASYRRALALTANETEARYLERRLAEVS